MRLLTLACIAIVVLSPARPVLSHHSTANFDQTKLSTVTGTVKYFSFTNPHSFIDLEVPGEDGKIRSYKIFTVAKVVMMRNGWANGDVKPGDRVVISGYADRKDPTFMYLTKIVFASGKTWSRDTIE